MFDFGASYNGRITEVFTRDPSPVASKAAGKPSCQYRSVYRNLDYFRLAGNPRGGFVHGCFQGKNVYDALNNAMPGSAREGIMCLKTWNERRCAHGFASRIQRFNENRHPGAD
jgi:hypothetical protein